MPKNNIVCSIGHVEHTKKTFQQNDLIFFSTSMQNAFDIIQDCYLTNTLMLSKKRLLVFVNSCKIRISFC